MMGFDGFNDTNLMTSPEWGGINHDFTFGVFSDANTLNGFSCDDAGVNIDTAGLVMDQPSLFDSDAVMSSSIFEDPLLW